MMTTVDGQIGQRARVEVTGAMELDGELVDVFSLFTPEGERSWVPNWDPQYPAANAPREAPGSTFITHNRSVPAIWVNVELDRANGRGRYVNVMPEARAALVSVDAVEAGGEKTRVRVTYALTSLSPEYDQEVLEFETRFEDMLGEWKRLIARARG